jgi:hypothetical protein
MSHNEQIVKLFTAAKKHLLKEAGNIKDKIGDYPMTGKFTIHEEEGV